MHNKYKLKRCPFSKHLIHETWDFPVMLISNIIRPTVGRVVPIRSVIGTTVLIASVKIIMPKNILNKHFARAREVTQTSLAICTTVVPFRRANNAAYWHDCYADKLRYSHNKEIDIHAYV